MKTTTNPSFLAPPDVKTGTCLGITQVNTEAGRYYLTPEGNRYPSATTVVGILNEKHIAKWIASVGAEKAEEVKRKAGEHGTRWHDLMETTIKKGIQNVPWTKEFGTIYPLITKAVYPNISNVRAVECQMYSDKLRMAGTVDLIADYKGKLSIIDWKTTRHEKMADEAISYWCQTASYAYMAYERYGWKPEQLVLVFNENDRDYYVYTQEVSRWVPRVYKLRKQYEKRYGI